MKYPFKYKPGRKQTIYSLLFASIAIAWLFDVFSPSPTVPHDLKNLAYEKWEDTESGRFAHSLQYEDKLAKPVPYNFNYFNNYEKESINYFEHLCATEGKDYIYKTAKDVDTIAQLRSFEIPFEEPENPGHGPQYYKFHPYALESPVFFDEVLAGLIDNQMHNKGHMSTLRIGAIRGIYGNPYTNYEVKFNNGGIYNYKLNHEDLTQALKNGNLDTRSLKNFESVQKLDKITAKYGFTWRGFNRPKDRHYGIAGGDLIIIDLEKNEIMAIQRTFIKGFVQRNHVTNLNWEGVGCFEQYKNDSVYKDINLTNKSFKEKSKEINYISPSRGSMPYFIRKVLISINK